MRQIKELQYLRSHPFCIYGAGTVATSVYAAIKTLYDITPLCFLVSDSAGRGGLDKPPEEIDGISVRRLSEWKPVSTAYLIATPEEHHAAIIEGLRSLMKDPCIIPVTNTMENELMEAYYSADSKCGTVGKLLSESRAGESVGTMASEVRVFQAKSHMDKLLGGQHSQLKGQTDLYPRYIIPIQVGTALTTRTIAEVKDNTGDNISDKNRNYCELTATYYAWKHSNAAYKGICHYRRILDISDMQIQALLEKKQEWDVIMPYPSVQYPDISAQHTRYVKEGDWNAMLQALQETAPEYLEAYEEYVATGGQFFNNFNILIAKAPVFDDYCSFLFRVLRRTEELTTPKGWERADRFAGYLGENLTTIYFIKKREILKIAYAGKLCLT